MSAPDDPSNSTSQPAVSTELNDPSPTNDIASDTSSQSYYFDTTIAADETTGHIGDSSTESAGDYKEKYRRLRIRMRALEEKLETLASAAEVDRKLKDLERKLDVDKKLPTVYEKMETAEKELKTFDNKRKPKEDDRNSETTPTAYGLDEKLGRKRVQQNRILNNNRASNSYSDNFSTLVNKAMARKAKLSVDTPDDEKKSGEAQKVRRIRSYLRTTIDDVGTTSADIVLSNVTYARRSLRISLWDFVTGITKVVSMRSVMSRGTRIKRKRKLEGRSMAWRATEVMQEFPPLTWVLLLWPVILPLWIVCFGTLTLLQFFSWRVGRRAIKIPDFSLGLEDTVFTTGNTEENKYKFYDFRLKLKVALEKIEADEKADEFEVPRFDGLTQKLSPDTLLSYKYLTPAEKRAVKGMIATLCRIYLDCSQIHFRKIKDRWGIVGSVRPKESSFAEKSGTIPKFQLLAHNDAVDETLTEIYESINRKKSEISQYSSGGTFQDLGNQLSLCGIMCSIIIDCIPFGESAKDSFEDTPVGLEKTPEGYYKKLPSRQTVNTTSFPNTDIEEFLSYTIPTFLNPVGMAFTAANTLISTFVAKDIYQVNTSVLIAFAAIGMYSSIFIDIASSAVNNYIFGGKYTYMHYAPLSHRNVRWTGWFYFDTYISFIRRQHSLLASYIENAESGYVLSDDAGLFDGKTATVVGSNPLHTVKSAYISDAVLEKVGIQLSATKYLLPTEPNTIVTKVNTREFLTTEYPHAVTTIVLDLWELTRAVFDMLLGWLIPIFEPEKKYEGHAVKNDGKGIPYDYGFRKAWQPGWFFCCPKFIFKCERCDLLDIKSFTVMHHDKPKPPAERPEPQTFTRDNKPQPPAPANDTNNTRRAKRRIVRRSAVPPVPGPSSQDEPSIAQAPSTSSSNQAVQDDDIIAMGFDSDII